MSDTLDYIELTLEQRMAYLAMQDFHAGEGHEFTLFGVAGTGKTTLLTKFAHEHAHLCVVTLTGKAASVLQRKGLDACTIHSFFYRLRDVLVDPKTGKSKLQFDPRFDPDERPLTGQLVMIDESSMVTERIATDIKATGARMLAVGDPGQLRPFHGEPYFDRGDVELEQIHRQALDSPIIRQAHQVRQGSRYEADGVVQVRYQVQAADLLGADVVLCWTNEQRINLNTAVRRLKGLVVPEPQAGEPVMCLKNLSMLGLYNGAVYTLLAPFKAHQSSILVEVDGAPVQIAGVEFEGLPCNLPAPLVQTKFAFGYACTVHKAAGSEWPNVVLYDTLRMAKPDLRRRWLYTGITRAIDSLVIVTG